MSKPLLSKNKADAVSNGAFLISLGALFYFNWWWPGILIAVWLTLSLRQLLTGRMFDFTISSIALIGLFLVSLYNLNWSVVMPVLFVLCGIYLIIREYFYQDPS